jgi:hypothetical protein
LADWRDPWQERAIHQADDGPRGERRDPAVRTLTRTYPSAVPPGTCRLVQGGEGGSSNAKVHENISVERYVAARMLQRDKRNNVTTKVLKGRDRHEEHEAVPRSQAAQW